MWADAAGTGEGLLEALTCYYDEFFAEEEARIRPADMSLVPGLYPHEPSQRIDHCFYRDFTDEEFKATGSGLVLTEDPAIVISNPNPPPDDLTLHYLSDHYGVHCIFGPVE